MAALTTQHPHLMAFGKVRDLEPVAARLPALCGDLCLAQTDGAAMLPHALSLRDRKPGDASGHSYVALALALTGQIDEALTAMRQSSRLASDKKRKEGLKTLERLGGEHPAHAEVFRRLSDVLREAPKTDGTPGV